MDEDIAPKVEKVQGPAGASHPLGGAFASAPPQEGDAQLGWGNTGRPMSDGSGALGVIRAVGDVCGRGCTVRWLGELAVEGGE